MNGCVALAGEIAFNVCGFAFVAHAETSNYKTLSGQ